MSTTGSTILGVSPAHLQGFIKGYEDARAGRLLSPEASRKGRKERLKVAYQSIFPGQS